MKVLFTVTNLGVAISKEELHRVAKKWLGEDYKGNLPMEELCNAYVDAKLNMGLGFAVEDIREEE